MIFLHFVCGLNKNISLSAKLIIIKSNSIVIPPYLLKVLPNIHPCQSQPFLKALPSSAWLAWRRGLAGTWIFVQTDFILK